MPRDTHRLPDLPAITLHVARDRGAEAGLSGGFLNLRRLELVATYPSGIASAPFKYDVATRASLDAVVMLAHYRDDEGEVVVYLRSAIRPPVALREIEPFDDGRLWEAPAGLIDPGEDARTAAARELDEELGVKVDPSALQDLGPWSYPTPGVIGERHVFFHVEVDPRALREPAGDGPLEREASVCAIRLRDALERARLGELRDAKTELALRRLAELP